MSGDEAFELTGFPPVSDILLAMGVDVDCELEGSRASTAPSEFDIDSSCVFSRMQISMEKACGKSAECCD